MFGKSYWYGREVEGRFSDIDTVFVRSEIPSNYNDYPHIYFTIEYIRSIVNDNNWAAIHKILDTRQIVTIEAAADVFDKIPMSVFNRAHIIYRIPDTHATKLKQTDTISLDAGWYRVMQIMKCNLMEMTPDSYKHDRIQQ